MQLIVFLLIVSFATVPVVAFRTKAALVRSYIPLFSVDDFSRPPPIAKLVATEEVAAEKVVDEQEIPKKDISDAMRDKLRRELQAQGADANVSAGNPILAISAIIAILVILGGKGFFF